MWLDLHADILDEFAAAYSEFDLQYVLEVWVRMVAAARNERRSERRALRALARRRTRVLRCAHCGRVVVAPAYRRQGGRPQAYCDGRCRRAEHRYSVAGQLELW